MFWIKKTLSQVSCRKAPRLNAWLKLAAGVGLIIFFMHIAGPFLLKFPGLSALAKTIEIENIKATAIYYTDLDQFAQAEAALRDNIEFRPLNDM